MKYPHRSQTIYWDALDSTEARTLVNEHSMQSLFFCKHRDRGFFRVFCEPPISKINFETLMTNLKSKFSAATV